MRLSRRSMYALAALAIVCGPLGCRKRSSVPLPPLPAYEAKRADGPITIDGKLDEETWRKAPTMVLTLREGTGAPEQATEARVLWDDDALYVAFVCHDDEMWATMTERDMKLWQEEVVEVFLDPNGTGDPYFEIEVNPLNKVVDLRFIRSLKGLRSPRTLSWDCKGFKKAVVAEGTVHTWTSTQAPGGRWTVEMAIPFAALDSLPNSPPKPGDAWKANFYRIDRPAALGEEDDEYSCWSPIVISGSYHTLERFGTLVFVAE